VSSPLALCVCGNIYLADHIPLGPLQGQILVPPVVTSEEIFEVGRCNMYVPAVPRKTELTHHPGVPNTQYKQVI
jgi:hypothetical protein